MNMTTERFEKFVAALETLCLEHHVHLGTTGYEFLEVWDIENFCTPFDHIECAGL